MTKNGKYNPQNLLPLLPVALILRGQSCVRVGRVLTKTK